MKLSHIDFDKLVISAANMRHDKKPPDIADILPSIRARGVLVPLIVRANGSPGTFEIVAGRRRYFAAKTVAEEQAAAGDPPNSAEPLPCAIIESGDDAAALEASLIENIARLDPDEVTRWETFARLIKEGRGVEDIAATFGFPEVMVKRTIALGNLHPRIRKLYREEAIDAASIRHLTLAPIARQREWLKLHNDPNSHAPRGHQLKAWLFGGASISTKVALFDLGDYPGQIVADLFGEESYFGDAEAFWTMQNEAVEAKAEGFREAGWAGVEIVPPGSYFQRWEHERTPRSKGGKVFILVSARGEVEVHEGYLNRRELQRKAMGGDGAEGDKPARPEITAAMQAYVDLHRHSAVRASLADRPGDALRLALAHVIVGSSLFSARPDPQRAPNDAVAASVEKCTSEAAFDTSRRAAMALLGFDPEASTVLRGYAGEGGIAGLFAMLLALSDEEILSILAVAMGEALEVGSAAVEALALCAGGAPATAWTLDDAFFDGIRDREVLLAMLAEIGGKAVAEANKAEKTKVLKALIRDHLDGTNGRAKVGHWVPGWLAFPPRAYTKRGGVGAVDRHHRVSPLFGAAE